MNSRITGTKSQPTPYRFQPQPLPFVWGRGSWSAHPPTRALVPLGTVDTITIHHTVSAPAAPYREIRNVQAYHLGQGFSDIGYHFLVDRATYVDGRDVYWGRQTQPDGFLSLGAHTREHNQGNVGVAVLGDYEQDVPSSGQLDILARFLAWLCYTFGVSPDRIYGHADLRPTACPGKHLRQRLPGLRWQVTCLLQGLPFPPPTDPLPDRQIRVLLPTGPLAATGTRDQGIVWVPVRALGAALGYQTDWDDNSRTAFLYRQRHPHPDWPPLPSPQARVIAEDQVLPLHPPAFVSGGTTLAPLDALAAALRLTLLWDEPSLTAVLLPR